jgi:peptidoglycan/LPS O-acetylase OafA/YrhL
LVRALPEGCHARAAVTARSTRSFAMGAAAKESESFDFVNLLRGIAAPLVLYYHLYIFAFHQYGNGEPTRPGSLSDLLIVGQFDLGKFAVGLFFIISGFLIPATLARPTSTLRDYLIHRVCRLYPAYWVSLALAVGLGLFFAPRESFPASLVLINVTMLQKFFGLRDVIGAYWTLQIEIIFYFICALLFLTGNLARRREMIWLSLAGGLVCALLRHHLHREFPVAIFIALSLMFLGDSIRAFSRKLLPRRQLIGSALLVTAALIPICMIAYTQAGVRYVLTYWAAIGVFLLCYSYRALFHDVRPIRWAGLFLADCSYSVYLLHAPIGLRLGNYVFLRSHNQALTLLVAFGSTFVCAYVTYRLVEAPGILFGRKLTPQNRRPTPLVAMA